MCAEGTREGKGPRRPFPGAARGSGRRPRRTEAHVISSHNLTNLLQGPPSSGSAARSERGDTTGIRSCAAALLPKGQETSSSIAGEKGELRLTS